MERINLNNTLHLTFPEGFRKLNEEEMKQMRTVQQGPGVCLRNDDRHIIVSLGYRKAGLLDALLNGDLIKSAQNRISGAMRACQYHLTGYQSCRVGDKTAQSFQYTYTAQNTDMVGECCALQVGKTIYYLHFYVRKPFEDDGLRLWKEILESAAFS